MNLRKTIDRPERETAMEARDPNDRPERVADDWGYELLLQGNEEILRGSDTGTLVAFAALAYQQIRGKGELHHNFGCGLLLLSVLLCAVVHLSIGNAYVRRAKSLIQGRGELRRLLLSRKVNISVAWGAVVVQFFAAITGTVLVLVDRAPLWLKTLVERLVP